MNAIPRGLRARVASLKCLRLPGSASIDLMTIDGISFRRKDKTPLLLVSGNLRGECNDGLPNFRTKYLTWRTSPISTKDEFGRYLRRRREYLVVHCRRFEITEICACSANANSRPTWD